MDAVLFPAAPATELYLLLASTVRWLLCYIRVVKPVDSEASIIPFPPVLIVLGAMRLITIVLGSGTSSASPAAPGFSQKKNLWLTIGSLLVWFADLFRMRCFVAWFLAAAAYSWYEDEGRKVMLILCVMDVLGVRIFTIDHATNFLYATFVYYNIYVSLMLVYVVMLAVNPEFLETIKAGYNRGRQDSSPLPKVTPAAAAA